MLQHDLSRPGSAVRMFMRPFVGAECAQHIHVNVLPGCFQISRANPKRPQTLKRGFVLETHWHHLFGPGVRQKGQFWRTWNAGLFTWSRARGLHKLASQACLDSLVSPPLFLVANGDFVERAAHVVNWMRVDGKLAGFAAGRCGQASLTWWV